ncbi:YceI family protein [Massilia sp. SM-13]|uniref:YceI family protein n=1 Tax=Pseudoduganella rhizocola TaxID=3382643 RepID=UPI0038B59D60
MKIIPARGGCAAAAALILAACGTVPPAPPAVPAAVSAPGAALPAPPLLRDTAPHQGLLRIAAERSLITIVARRAGRLAGLGHDHLLAAHGIEGDIAPAEGRAMLRFRLDALAIDEAPLRAAAGLQRQPGEAAIAGTRTNMLKALDAEHYPWVAVTVQAMERGIAQADITLHGHTRRYAVPVASRREGGTLHARGSLRIRQTHFGIAPYSVLNGALSVDDELELSFELLAG